MTLWLEDNLASRKVVIQRAILFSAVTLFILFVFQPFGTINSTISYKFLRLSGYSLVTFCALFLSGTLEIILSRHKLSNRLRLCIIPCLYIGIVAVFNHSYFVVSIMGAWHWQNQLLFILFTLAIGIFPISLIYIFNRYSTKAQQGPQAEHSTIISSPPLKINEPFKSSLITLTGENKGDILQLALSQLLFIKSADNYCELAILIDNKVSHKLLRSSLTRILRQLPNTCLVHRCHRSYAVNIALVEQSNGNASGLQLLMKPMSVTVPVSRSYVDAIKQALQLAPKAC